MAAVFAVTSGVHAQQRNVIEVKEIENPGRQTLSDGKVLEPDGMHEFAIRANEESDIHLNFKVTHGELNVLVRYKNEKVVCSKKFDRKSSSMTFTMDQNAEYTVSLSASPNTRYSVSVDENQ